MKEENLGLAMLLAKQSSLRGKLATSTSRLAEQTGFSQQSISRKLREMETEGIIARNASASGMEVSFTQKGRAELESLYLELKEIFSGKKFVLTGKLVDGHGEGAYYTSLPEYNRQFKQLFGKEIFPGTLNLEVEPEQREVFTSAAPTKIAGFTDKQRTFGGIDCWPCMLNGKVDAFAIIPHRTNHPKNILELIARHNLRKKLSLKNGSIVKVERK
ncbi:MAG: DUF120 domain-containing protein [archaeon]